MDRTRLAMDSVVYFFYGLGFFVLGMVTAFQYRARSEFRLTKSIWALACFGVLHAFHEWIRAFLPIQEAVLTPSGVIIFRMAEEVFRALSWTLLLYFGVTLLPNERGAESLRKAPLVIFLGWLIVLSRAQRLLVVHPVPLVVALGDLNGLGTLAHFVLGVPAALITAWTLLGQAREFRATRLDRLVRPLLTAGWAFFSYAVLVALAMLSPGLDQVTAPTWKWLVSVARAPVQVMMLITVVAMTVATVRVLAVFSLEGERRLEEAETQRAILNERLRISRDLHDGVMQSIYAVGLSLENVLFLLNEDRNRAQKELERSMVRLNDTIRDIRGYILNLRPARRSAGDLYASVLEVVAQFRSGVAVRANIELEPLRRVSLPTEQVEQVCQIIREALTNVARHAYATEVAVAAHVRWGEQAEISVWDNGRGFQPGGDGTGVSQGLGNMRARAEALGGNLTVNSRRGRGTEVVLRLPLEGGTESEPTAHPNRAGG
jgi:signal transduction histidine kinase